MATAILSLEAFPGLTHEALAPRLLWLREVVAPRLERYLGYYRNSTTDLAENLPCPGSANFAVRPFRQFQELGLPARITGFRHAADGAAVATGPMEIQRKEVVIENDIGWRINTLVDFAAGRMPAITSTAADPAVQRRLTAAIAAIFDAAGGATLLQQLVLHGALAGSAWVQIRPSAELLTRLRQPLAMQAAPSNSAAIFPVVNPVISAEAGSGLGAEPFDPDVTSTETSTVSTGEQPLEATRWFRIEIVKASQLCPLPHAGESSISAELSPAYAALLTEPLSPPPGIVAPGIMERLRSWFARPAGFSATAETLTFDIFGSARWQRYLRGSMVEEGDNPLGFVPFIRYENAAEPAAGSRVGPRGSGAVDVGASDVEPLIGLQDELNTRLSDRAYRVTMTSFRMWLGRGIEDFTSRPVGPGQMWATDNPAATIESFGGDATTPSEDSHIEEIREALDKISGVPPVAAGVLRAKLGNLTSAVALRVTLIALLARTERKRAALSQTLGLLVRRLLELLDRAQLVASAPADRGIDVNWPTALPESDMDRLQEAQLKLALGVPRSVVLGELGYSEVVAPPQA